MRENLRIVLVAAMLAMCAIETSECCSYKKKHEIFFLTRINKNSIRVASGFWLPLLFFFKYFNVVEYVNVTGFIAPSRLAVSDQARFYSFFFHYLAAICISSY